MSHALIDDWHRLAAEEPNALAVIDDGRHWSRRELNDLVLEIERQLADEPLCRSGVLLHLPNSARWLASFIALRRAGAVVIPLDAATTPQKCCELAHQLRSFALQSSGLAHRPDKPRQWKAQLALVKLTSGTSGAPRAIAFSEAELRADGKNIMATMGFGAADLNYALLPLAHSYALGNLVAPMLSHGVPMMIGSAPLPRVIAEEIKTSGATVLPSVPSIFEALARTDDLSLGKLRLCITAAAALCPQLAQAFAEKFQLRLHNFYGASECGGIAYDRTGECGLTGDSVGHAMDGVDLSTTPDGRLRVRSQAVSRYGKQADAGHPATVTLDDKVNILPDGRVAVQGRADRVVKCGGRRVDLAAIERAGREAPGIQQIAAVYLAAQDRILAAYVGPAPEAAIEPHLQSSLGAAARRLRLRRVDRLPVTLRGKVDYAALAASFS